MGNRYERERRHVLSTMNSAGEMGEASNQTLSAFSNPTAFEVSKYTAFPRCHWRLGQSTTSRSSTARYVCPAVTLSAGWLNPYLNRTHTLKRAESRRTIDTVSNKSVTLSELCSKTHLEDESRPSPRLLFPVARGSLHVQSTVVKTSIVTLSPRTDGRPSG